MARGGRVFATQIIAQIAGAARAGWNPDDFSDGRGGFICTLCCEFGNLWDSGFGCDVVLAVVFVRVVWVRGFDCCFSCLQLRGSVYGWRLWVH